MKLFDSDHRMPKCHLVGTHRSAEPSATLARFLPLAGEFGITRLANVTGLDHIGIPVYQCIRPNSKTLSVSQGKGLDPVCAKVSALMESIEGWHAETPNVDTRYGTVEAINAHATAVDLSTLPRRSTRVLRPEERHVWARGFDVIRDRETWVPFELLDLDRVDPSGCTPTFRNDSNGLASGNHILEAIHHGLCEVIERDAHTLWHYDASDPMGLRGLVDPSTVCDPACREVLDRFARADLRVAMQDISSDINVPCFQCVVIDSPESMRPLGHSWGQGCHPSPGIALLRALTEAAQARLTFIAGARDDLTYRAYAAMQHDEEVSYLSSLLESAPRPVDFRNCRSLATDSFEGDLEAILAQVRACGLDQVVVVDLTRADLGVPVVKVIVPGLEGAITEPSEFVPGPRARARATQIPQRPPSALTQTRHQQWSAL